MDNSDHRTVKHFADLQSQRIRSEWLFDEVKARMEESGLADLICIAGHQNHSHLGSQTNGFLCELASVHARHHDVCECQVDGAGVCLADWKSLLAIAGLDDVIAA